MEDNLIEILESKFSFPVIRQGSLSENEAYPDHFFTYWNNDSADHAHYDNVNFGSYYTYDVLFYSVDPALCYKTLREAQAELKKQGWISSGDGFDVASDEPTHIGRGITVTYLKI